MRGKDNFIFKSKKIHDNKYDYSKVEYKDCKTKVCIICPEHGEFFVTPDKHINRKQGCNKCTIERIKLLNRNTTEEFIEKAKKIHGDKYDYSKVEYVNNKTKVCIICPIHGEFWQTPNNHYKYGCHKCIGMNKTNSEFINDAKLVHGDRYDYSKVEYKDSRTKVCIICPKHGEFWQTPKDHLKGNGCPKCNNSKLEIIVEDILQFNNIHYISQYKPLWLKNGKGQKSLDFYLPDYNIAIECQGIQHFKPVKYWGGYKKFIYTLNNDIIKNIKSNENNIELIYVTNIKPLPKNIFKNKLIHVDELINNLNI